MHRFVRRLIAPAIIALAALAPSAALAQFVPVQQMRTAFASLNTERCGHGYQERTRQTDNADPFGARFVLRDSCPEGRAVSAVGQHSTIESDAITAVGAAYSRTTDGGEGLLTTFNVTTAMFDFQAPADTEIIISGVVSARATELIDLADAAVYFGPTHGSPTFIQHARAEQVGERVTIRFAERMTLEGGLYHLQVSADTLFASTDTSAQQADAYFNVRIDAVGK